MTVRAGRVGVAWLTRGLVFASLAVAASGQLVRQANTTLVMPLNPPTTGFALEDALSPAVFTYPIAIATPPGESNRIFVAEKGGRIRVITDLTNIPVSPPVFLDITDRVNGPSPNDERGLLGLAFHPQFAVNGYFYVYYSTLGTLKQRVSRFQISGPGSNFSNPNTEVVLIDQVDPASNHNGGCLQFGPEGYLYISVGDGGGSNDSTNGSQKIDGGFFSGLLRIDVDRLAGNLEPNAHTAVILNPPVTGTANYKVPADNPWVGATTFNGSAVVPTAVRTEYYAVGLRNPWRFSVDPANGRIYVGDVGQGAREEVDLIRKGGNYGWKWREGFIATAGIGGSPPAGVVFDDPIIDYPRSDGYSITGGVVCRGTRLSQLYGQYIFADYGGNIWRLPLDPNTGVNTGPKVAIASEGAIAAFGVDPRNGDVLLANISTGHIRRLTPSGAPTGTLPATLSATGAFVDLVNLIPNAGIVPYTPNVSFWSDFANKRRWFSVPNVANKLTFSAAGNWSLPSGTVWVKHFDIETTRGVPATSRRLETRILVKNDAGIYGVTYRWNAGGTDANLVADAGDTETFTVMEGGSPRSQTWNYPSRSACLFCHTNVGGYALGFNAAQLNGPNVYNGQTQNQISALSGAGYFTSAVSSTNTMTKLAPATDTSQSVEWRVRSYLSVNCAQCHQPGGPALGSWDGRHTTKTASAGIINGVLNDHRGDPLNKVVVPNDLAHSMMYQRCNAAPGTGSIFMPPIATNERDPDWILLLADWIQTALPSYQTFAQWQVAKFGSAAVPEAQPTANPDGDFNDNRTEYLVGTNPSSPAEAWTYFVTTSGGSVTLNFPRVANRRFQVQVSSDLQTWSLWDVPANAPTYSSTSFMDVLTGPASPAPQYFRFEIDLP